MLDLIGLSDSYVHDGRVLIDQLDASAVPQSLIAHRETLRRLGDIYKQLNAPFGSFGMSLLSASTKAIASGNASDDSTYTAVENQITDLTNQRNALASQIKAALDGAAFSNTSLNEQQAKNWIDAAQSLIDKAALLGG
jgi:outer membrane murein-binding lipoprotein Lpp